MAADLPPDGLDSPEALREVILAQQRELDTLRRETAEVALLLDALDAVLRVEGDEDPFAAVFEILEPVFRFARALVLVEGDAEGAPLACIVASEPTLVGREWEASRFFDKVLGGRVTATMGSEALATPCGLSPDHPALYIPLGVRRGRGMMVLLREPADDGFDRRDIALARKFSLLASHALAAMSANRTERERRRLHRLTKDLEAAQATLAHRANYDELTGLPNRAHLEEHVTRLLDPAVRTPRDRLALAFIDLDGFKQVNDRHGHDVGDQLLVEVAQRVLAHIRATDTLARISGDEFLLVVDPLESDEVVDTIVERILDALKEPFVIGGVAMALSGSVGIATFPEHGSTYEQLRRNADLAMYSAKSRAKGTAAHFDVSLGRAALERAEREQVVRRAAVERRFRPVLQPLIRLTTMEVVGFEVLARREDEHGLLHPPADFVPIAAELGLLDAITSILVDEVVESLPAIDACFGDRVTLSLNVSARQAIDVASMRRLVERIQAAGATRRFVVEVTEDAYLHAGAFQREVVPMLRESGLRVSIDDFGTGYASLATLLDLTAHELKIDRAFVTDVHERPRSQVILRGVAAAAQALGISVVAEGVETHREFEYLRTVPGIDAAQGYLFAKPAPATQLIASAPLLHERLRSLHPATAAASVAAS